MITDNYKNRSVLLFLPANDFNEQEYLIIANALLKANVKIFIASDATNLCVVSNGLKVKNDLQLYNVNQSNFGGFLIIGGKGTRDYWNSKLLQSISKKFINDKKIVAAICSAPIILAKAGLIKECATCYSDDIRELEKAGVVYNNSSVLRSGNIITAKDPSSSNEFVNVFIHALMNK